MCPHEPPFLRGSFRRCKAGDRARPNRDHRCGTAPESHRTSLAQHHSSGYRSAANIERGRNPVKPMYLDSYVGIDLKDFAWTAPRKTPGARHLIDPDRVSGKPGRRTRKVARRALVTFDCGSIADCPQNERSTTSGGRPIRRRNDGSFWILGAASRRGLSARGSRSVGETVRRGLPDPSVG
jgi:hypothetical protein